MTNDTDTMTTIVQMSVSTSCTCLLNACSMFCKNDRLSFAGRHVLPVLHFISINQLSMYSVFMKYSYDCAGDDGGRSYFGQPHPPLAVLAKFCLSAKKTR